MHVGGKGAVEVMGNLVRGEGNHERTVGIVDGKASCSESLLEFLQSHTNGQKCSRIICMHNARSGIGVRYNYLQIAFFVVVCVVGLGDCILLPYDSFKHAIFEPEQYPS